MKKTPLVCVILLVAGLGFADPLEMTHRKIHIDSQNPSRTDTYINRSSDNMQITDPIVATAALNNWREKTTSTLVVDKNGRGDYTTIQGAIDAINDSAPTNPYVVYVMPGIYDEQVTLTTSYVSLIGIQPNGAAITETQNSGAIITHESSGVGTDIQTLWIKSGGATDLAGITIANLTIINTAAEGVGPAQEALNIGGGDTMPRTHEILIKNCSLYGEQDAVFVNTGNPIFQNCFVSGINDVFSAASACSVYDSIIHSHRVGSALRLMWFGCSGDPAFTVNFVRCDFSCISDSAYRGLLITGTNNITVSLYHCNLLPNLDQLCNFDSKTTCTVNLFSTSGPMSIVNVGAGDTVNYIPYQGGLNVGTATGAAVGEIKTSGNISASGQRITAKLFDVEHYTGWLPTASSTYRGCLAFVEAGTGSNDKLYVCVKNADGSYGWDEIGQGTSESRIRFE